MNNFNTAMELVAGINSMAVERLKKTWSKVPAVRERACVVLQLQQEEL